MKSRVGDLAILIQLNGYLGVSFDASYRIDDDALHVDVSLSAESQCSFSGVCTPIDQIL